MIGREKDTREWMILQQDISSYWFSFVSPHEICWTWNIVEDEWRELAMESILFPCFIYLRWLFTMDFYDWAVKFWNDRFDVLFEIVFRSLGNLEWLIWKNGKIIHRSWLRIETKRKERNIGKFFIVSNILQSLSFMIKK